MCTRVRVCLCACSGILLASPHAHRTLLGWFLKTSPGLHRVAVVLLHIVGAKKTPVCSTFFTTIAINVRVHYAFAFPILFFTLFPAAVAEDTPLHVVTMFKGWVFRAALENSCLSWINSFATNAQVEVAIFTLGILLLHLQFSSKCRCTPISAFGKHVGVHSACTKPLMLAYTTNVGEMLVKLVMQLLFVNVRQCGTVRACAVENTWSKNGSCSSCSSAINFSASGKSKV